MATLCFYTLYTLPVGKVDIVLFVVCAVKNNRQNGLKFLEHMG